MLAVAFPCGHWYNPSWTMADAGDDRLDTEPYGLGADADSDDGGGLPQTSCVLLPATDTPVDFQPMPPDPLDLLPPVPSLNAVLPAALLPTIVRPRRRRRVDARHYPDLRYAEAVARYIERRARRVSVRRVKYPGRHAHATSRPRYRGRFT